MSKRALVSIIDGDDSIRQALPGGLLRAVPLQVGTFASGQNHEARARALRAGAAAFLPKPFDAAVSRSAVEAALLES